MLIDFRVSNDRAMGEEQILSLVPAAKQKEYSENIIQKGNRKALNALGIYGANASGKSNLLNSIEVFKDMVLQSTRNLSTSKLPYDPFLLRMGWGERPTKFEINFLDKNGYKYRYGFEYIREAILSEWMFKKSVGREVVVFLRDKEAIEVGGGLHGNKRVIEAAIEATGSNALFLSFCNAFLKEETKSIFEWLDQLVILNGLSGNHWNWQTAQLWDSTPEGKKVIQDFLAKVKNLGFSDLNIRRRDDEVRSAEMSPFEQDAWKTHTQSWPYAVSTKHRLYDKNGKPSGQFVEWDILQRESIGSNKLFTYLGPILQVLSQGGVLVADEMEALMHPLLTLELLNLFLNPKTNPKQAQIIFSTHDTNLLTYARMRRDQWYFAEKNEWESTEVFSLSDFVYLGKQKEGDVAVRAKERPDADKEKRYLEGRYGAVPLFRDATSTNVL